MVKILILSAFPPERTAIDALFPGAERVLDTSSTPKNVLKAEYHDMTIYLSYTGLGSSLSACNTAVLCERLQPDLVIFCGVAGGVCPDTQKHGDIIAVTGAHHKDFDHLPQVFTEGSAYHGCLFDPHTGERNSYHFAVEPALLDCLKTIYPENSFGAIATSNAFPTPPGKYPEVLETCVAIEMEGAAVMEAATCPVIILRSLSNLLDKEGKNLGEPEGIIALCAHNLAQALQSLLASPALKPAIEKAHITFLKNKLRLTPHQEDGCFNRIYEAKEQVSATHNATQYTLSNQTAIHYLLEKGDFSIWHRLAVSSETWQVIQGDHVNVHILNPETRALTSIQIGSDAQKNYTVPAGHWFCAEPAAGAAGFSLCTCTVTPGFSYELFELAQIDQLCKDFSAHVTFIQKFTRSPGHTVVASTTESKSEEESFSKKSSGLTRKCFCMSRAHPYGF